MPLPLFFIGAAAVTAVVGAGKTIKAGVDTSTAKDINESAQRNIDDAKSVLDQKRNNVNVSLTDLGEEKVYILNHNIHDFLESFTKLKNVDFQNSTGLDEIRNVKFDKTSFSELKDMENIASSFVTGAAAGAAGGALAAFGAYGAAQALATASTGTAIASLSGAAATNATLAFFGGGALTAGGLGVAGGTAVLGGLVAGPALLVMGLITGANADKKLDEARSNKAKAQEICEQLKTVGVQCDAIRRRAYLFYNLLARLDACFLPLIFKMEDIVKNEGSDYQQLSLDSQKTIAAAATVALSVKSVLDTGILTESGELTSESEQMAEEVDKNVTKFEEENK